MGRHNAPTRIVLYSYQQKNPIPAAEFRWDPATGVTLKVLDPDHGGKMAQDYFERGAPLDVEKRAVSPSEGPTFMRALLQPSRMSYFAFKDESDEDEATLG